MNNFVHKPKKLLMAADIKTLDDYINRRNLVGSEYLCFTHPGALSDTYRGQDITLVLTECDWQAERALRDMAISRDMVITETYG